MTPRRKRDSTSEAAHSFDPGTASSGAASSRGGEETPPASPHARRFAFLTGALLAFATLAIIAAGMIASGRDDSSSLTVDLSWSQFRPQDKDPDAGAREIADHVGREYKLSNQQSTRRQMVAVTGGAMEVQGLPINLAFRETPADGGGIDLAPGNGVLYRMCGLGPSCSIDRGRPSAARELLLRRQALELALYSFKYLKKTDNVVVFMPAGRQRDGSVDTEGHTALFFQQSELKSQLRQPLDRTLPGPTPTPSTMARSPSSQDINQFTSSHRFNYNLTQANSESSVFLVLDPVQDEPALPQSPASAGPGAGSKSTSPGTSKRSGSSGTAKRGGSSSGSSGASGNGVGNGPTIVQPLSPTAPG